MNAIKPGATYSDGSPRRRAGQWVSKPGRVDMGRVNRWLDAGTVTVLWGDCATDCTDPERHEQREPISGLVLVEGSAW